MFLDRIVATKKEEVEKLRSELTVKAAEMQIAQMPSCLGFEHKLLQDRHRPMGLIAEVKKASPSKGLIRDDFDPVELAAAYERAGADCLSVLTDTPYFQGSSEYLRQVREQVRIPILKKDFMIDPLQIYEARLIGADAILLIAAILDNQQLKQYLGLARDLGLDALVEVHDQEELERVLELDVAMIGINNRNLRTFVTDLRTTETLIKHVPDNRLVISESGIAAPQDIDYLYGLGARAVLVGEHFMRQPSVEDAVHALMGPQP